MHESKYRPSFRQAGTFIDNPYTCDLTKEGNTVFKQIGPYGLYLEVLLLPFL
eukprot:jgi/Botrbrau1/21320/Bobra.0184s0030.1